MMWIFGIIGLLVLLIFIKFFRDSSRDSKYVENNGGMEVMYSTLIQGIISNNRFARVIGAGYFNSLDMEGRLSCVSANQDFGGWHLCIQHTFNIVQVVYRAKIAMNGEIIQKRWDFPVNTDQNVMVDTIIKEMDKTIVYAITL